MNLSGKSAVVTGGGNGIGKALCIALAKEHVNVAVADIDQSAAQATADELAGFGAKIIAVAADVTEEASVSELAARAWRTFGSVEILVNNAGVMAPAAPLAQTSSPDFNWIFAVNVGGALNGIRVFAPRFIESQQPSRILNTASEHALGVPHVGSGLYTASKHALLGLSDVLRRELPDHVKVTVLCPGIVNSTLWKATERRQATYGGPTQALENGGAFMQQMGMPAADVALKAIEGMRLGHFYVVTHPHAINIARTRWTELDEAFANQAPRQPGDEKYDLEPIMRQFLANHSNQWN